MMNGALTIGTRDGATIEMAREVGDANIFLFGLTAEQVASNRAWYQPRWHYEHEPEIREAVDVIRFGRIRGADQGLFDPIVRTLLDSDHYMHLADLTSYSEAQARVAAAYADGDEWARKMVRNIAGSARFSSDRTIKDYATEIWRTEPCPVP
jgi:starch phosphorylase